MLAVADAVAEGNVSPGQVAASMLVLSAMTSSLFSILVRGAGLRKGIPLLPQADRGLLRVPETLTLIGCVLGAMTALMATASLFQPAAETLESGVVSSEQMISMLLQNVVLDGIVFFAFGGMVLAASRNGRVSLFEASREVFNGQALTVSSEDIGTAEMPFPERVEISESVPSADSAPSLSEPYHYGKELRFAAEVFLLTYLPTTVLRIGIMKVMELLTGGTVESHPFLEMLSEGIPLTGVFLIVILAIGIAPVVEELFYRVVVFGGLTQMGLTKTGAVFSSICFCLAHGFPDSLALLPLAFMLSYTYIRRRSYRTVIMVHLLFNGFNMLLAGCALV